MTELREHPSIGKMYEIVIGGIAYGGQCRRVFVERDGGYVAECQYFNDSNPDNNFKVLVDSSGNSV